MNEKLKQFFTGIGVLAEATKASYDAFITAGFAPDNALYLAGEFMKKSLRLGAEKDHKEDD